VAWHTFQGMAGFFRIDDRSKPAKAAGAVEQVRTNR
jgi:hypothetical protein